MSGSFRALDPLRPLDSLRALDAFRALGLLGALAAFCAFTTPPVLGPALALVPGVAGLCFARVVLPLGQAILPAVLLAILLAILPAVLLAILLAVLLADIGRGLGGGAGGKEKGCEPGGDGVLIQHGYLLGVKTAPTICGIISHVNRNV
jgi:hypothetical protein